MRPGYLLNLLKVKRRGPLPAFRASYGPSRSGAMQGIADRLIGSTAADLDSRAEWARAQRFFYNALHAVVSLLPKAAQEQLDQRGPELPAAAKLEAARGVLWTAIESDPMGKTSEGAAVRATLFAFFPPEEEGPLDAVALFCAYFARAGLPETELVRAFHEQWAPPE